MSNSLTVRISDGSDRIALCGGPYSNFAAVESFLTTTDSISHRFCLGDMGGFGPFPNRTLDLIRQSNLMCIQGNYDDAVGNGLRECGCGYSDERDRHFAQVSYDYTYANTSLDHRTWLKKLPQHIYIDWYPNTEGPYTEGPYTEGQSIKSDQFIKPDIESGVEPGVDPDVVSPSSQPCRILLCHGSPDHVNEFIWDSESSDAKIVDYLQRYNVDGICATHSGLPWIRTVVQKDGRPGFWFNVGVLGRPANTGHPWVNYGLLEWPLGTPTPSPRLMTLSYDVQATTTAMRAEGLPEEFAESLETGIWTTCAEILPAAERHSMPHRPVVVSR